MHLLRSGPFARLGSGVAGSAHSRISIKIDGGNEKLTKSINKRCYFSSDQIKRVKDQIGLLFFIATFWGFFSLYQSIIIFPFKLTMFAKKRSSESYFTNTIFWNCLLNKWSRNMFYHFYRNPLG